VPGDSGVCGWEIRRVGQEIKVSENGGFNYSLEFNLLFRDGNDK